MIEVLIAMSIMVFMSVIWFVGQNSNKARIEVESAARQLAAQIRQLQNESLNGKQINGTLVCDYIFEIAAVGSLSYDIKYNDCDHAGHSIIAAGTQNLSFNGKRTVKANTIHNFYFIPPLGKLTNQQQIILESTTNPGQIASVCVCTSSTGSGKIYDKVGNGACDCS